VLWKITEALARLVAPILSFTADEVWEYLPKVEGREASVHLALFPKPEEIFSEDPAPLMEEWKQLLAVRDEALRVLEESRQAKTIGKGLEADLHIYAKGAKLDLLKRHQAGLKELINVSSVVLLEWRRHSGPMDGDRIKSLSSPEDFAVFLSPASGQKCARCWNFMPDVSDYGIWHDVCGRCQSALREMGIEPPTADEPPEATA
jgi:isoleucyl-tRNA synthetase